MLNMLCSERNFHSFMVHAINSAKTSMWFLCRLNITVYRSGDCRTRLRCIEKTTLILIFKNFGHLSCLSF